MSKDSSFSDTNYEDSDSIDTNINNSNKKTTGFKSFKIKSNTHNLNHNLSN